MICPGFGLRVMPSGKKTFVYKYMNNRQGRWITIGKYSGWTIRKARGQYDLYYDQVHEYGRDPVQEIREAKGSGLTIDVVVENPSALLSVAQLTPKGVPAVSSL
jgi:hypothetical protein